MRIRKIPKQLLLATGLLLLSSSVLAQRVPQVGAGDAGGSPNQVAPNISQLGSIPPPLTAQQLIEFNEKPSYSITQPKADPCINGPCLKAAELIDPGESGKVGAVDPGGSPNQVAPAISQLGSVPPPLTAQQLMEFNEKPSYSITQPKADPCINGPCLKAAESIDPGESGTHQKTDLDLFQSGAKSIGADILIQKGIEEKVLGISGAKLAKQAIDLKEAPVIPILEALPYVGKVFTKAVTGAWAVTFEASEISMESELPTAIRKEQDARQAAAKARRDAIFEDVKLQNVDQQHQKDAMNAAAAASPSSNSTAVFVDMLNMTAQQYAQQKAAASGSGSSPIVANTGCLSPFVAGGCNATPVASGGCKLTAADRAKGKVCTAN